MASDFGSSASIYRVDGVPPDKHDEHRILAAARSLQLLDRDRIGPFAELELVVGSSQMDGVEGVDLRLTSYFYEDLGSDDLADAIIARDEITAHKFVAELEKLLGDEYRIDAYSGHW